MSALYRVVRSTLQFALKAYFREIAARGIENVPPDGPLIVAANHPCSMIDPFLVIAAVPRPVTFIAKEPLFRTPVVGWVLRVLGCVPAHRSQDAGYSKDKNEGLYRAAAGVLSRGGALGIFPEGKSNTAPHLAEFKHGVSKIALEADTSTGGVRIQLAGIHFEEVRGFRGRVLLQFAPPLALDGYRARHASQPRESIAALTADLQSQLSGLVLSAENRELAELADLVGRMGVLDIPGDSAVQIAFERKKRLLEGYEELKGRFPGEVEALQAHIRRYKSTLDLLQVHDDQVAADYRFTRVAGYALKNSLLLLLGLPFVAAGLAGNFIPYLITWGVARGWRKSEDQRATAGFITALFAFALMWAATGYAGFRMRGPWGAATAVATSVTCGLIALESMDRWHRLFVDTGGLWSAITLGSARATLRRMRARALSSVQSLLELHRKAAP